MTKRIHHIEAYWIHSESYGQTEESDQGKATEPSQHRDGINCSFQVRAQGAEDRQLSGPAGGKFQASSTVSVSAEMNVSAASVRIGATELWDTECAGLRAEKDDEVFRACSTRPSDANHRR